MSIRYVKNSGLLRREKMKRILMLTAIAGLLVLAAEGTGFSSAGKVAPDGISATAAPDIVIGMQADDGSFYVVQLELADKAVPAGAVLRSGIFQQLPDATTLVLLGVGGLFYRRKKE
jgi:hypothetical protein